MHPELERLEREFSWRMEDILTYDSEKSIWCSSDLSNKATAYGDEQWSSLDELLEAGWWTRVRNRIIERELRNSDVHPAIWDIGGGTGIVSSHLRRAGFSPLGVEPTLLAAIVATQRGVDTLSAELFELRLPTSGIHAVSMFDVLEHLDSRHDVLQEIHRILKPGGHLVITVPALSMLWSQHDVELGHRVRYSKTALRAELARSGFEVHKIGYFFWLTVLPLVFLRSIPYRLGFRRVVGQESALAANGGKVGNLLARLELATALHVPFGSSLLVVARKSQIGTDRS